MRIWPRIEPITSPTPGGCATSYATDAGICICKNYNNKLCPFFLMERTFTNIIVDFEDNLIYVSTYNYICKTKHEINIRFSKKRTIN